MVTVHALGKLARADAHECDTVAVRLVHVCLNLKDKRREVLVERADFLTLGETGRRRRGHIQEVLEERLDTEVGQRGAEEDRREGTGLNALQIEILAGAAQKLDVILQGVPQIVADQRLERRIIDGVNSGFCLARTGNRCRLECHDVVFLTVIDALEFFSAADRPVDRIGIDTELLFQLVQQIIRVAGLKIHLVDKCEDRDTAHGADLEQLARLRLDTLGGVDDHDGRIRRHQRAVGVLREVLMSRGIQNVDAVIRVLELQDRRGNRDAALFLDFHPVGNRMTRILFALYRTGELDCSAVQKEFFRNRCLTGVRVRNDRKRAALGNFFL